MTNEAFLVYKLSLRKTERLCSPHWRNRSTSLFLKASWDQQEPNINTWQPGSCFSNSYCTSDMTSLRSAYLAASSSTCKSSPKFFITQPSRLVNGSQLVMDWFSFPIPLILCKRIGIGCQMFLFDWFIMFPYWDRAHFTPFYMYN